MRQVHLDKFINRLETLLVFFDQVEYLLNHKITKFMVNQGLDVSEAPLDQFAPLLKVRDVKAFLYDLTSMLVGGQLLKIL